MSASASTVAYVADAVSVGDVVAYPAHPRNGRRDLDWLRVTRTDIGFVFGVRVKPQGEWDTDLEFAVYPKQLADHGVEVAPKP